MPSPISPRARRSLLSALVLSGVAVSTLSGPLHQAGAARPHDAAPPSADTTLPAGTDLWRLDAVTRQYTQGPDGLTDLRLYNSPVGYSGQNGWRLRDTRLGTPAADGTVSPANLPFGLRIATNSAAAALAALQNEDGVALGIGLAPAGGPLPAVSGQVSADAVTFSGLLPAPQQAATATNPLSATVAATGAAAISLTVRSRSDLALRPTVSGLDLRLVLHGPGAGGQVLIALKPDPRLQYVEQDASGDVHLRRDVTVYRDDGSAFTVEAAEYTIQAPTAVDSSADPAAPAPTGPVSITVAPAEPGEQDLAIAIDPAWLAAPGRVFPVNVDVPIVTAYSTAYTGLFGTLNSCAPATLAPLTEVVVGVEGACAYHGQVYFDTRPILSDTPIVSASLNLYTPAQSGPTGVLVYPNVPSADGATPQQQSWSSAPALLPDATGITQSGNAGHWQSWNVTSLVRQWVQDSRINGGLALLSDGAPVLFASPLGAGNDAPALAPYLDIVYAPRAPLAPSNVDGASYIYGLAGAFYHCNPGVIACQNGALSYTAAASNQPNGIGARLIRLQKVLPCGSPPSGYWSDIYGALGYAYSAGNTSLRVIPVVNFNPPARSSCVLTPSNWHADMADFVANLKAQMCVSCAIPNPLPATYFEIGNEEDAHADQYPDYTDEFYDAATGLYANLGGSGYSFPFYRLLTGGMAVPSADTSANCTPGHSYGNALNVQMAQSAISLAQSGGSYGTVNPIDLGTAVHPYSYATPRGADWQNYLTPGPGGQTYVSSCLNLDLMVSTWQSGVLAGKAVIYTEVDWSAALQPNSEEQEGTYLVDFFSYLDHKYCTGSPCGINPGSTPVRVLFFRGVDVNGPSIPLGVYYNNGTDKSVINLIHCGNSAINNGNSHLSNDYFYLRNGACY